MRLIFLQKLESSLRLILQIQKNSLSESPERERDREKTKWRSLEDRYLQQAH